MMVLITIIIFVVSFKSEQLYKTAQLNKLSSQKMQLASKLAELARSRTRLTGKMIYVEDYFVKDEISLKLDSLAAEFSVVRNQLLKLPLDEKEKSLLEKQASIVPIILPAQRKAADLALDDDPASIKEAQHLLYDVVLPGQDTIIGYLLQLLDKQKMEIDAATTQSEKAHQNLVRFNKFVFIIVLFLAVLFAIVIIVRIRNIETALIYAKEENIKALEELRLYANAFEYSGEAMVITNQNNHIINVNSAFSKLTGYHLNELTGKDPKILSSGKTPKETFEKMWLALKKDGFWQGELWDRKKNGAIYPKWISISALKDSRGVAQHYIASFTDITDRKNSEERIEHLAHHDILTGLYNRFSLGERLAQLLLSAKRDQKHLAVLFIDLDKFKNVNDTFGHMIGDKLLVNVALRIKRSVRESDIPVRNGGDEFVVVISDIKRTEYIGYIAEKIMKEISLPYLIDAHKITITPSMGISLFPEDGTTEAELLKNADVAMYHAKELGRNNFQLFSQDMLQKIQQRLSIEHELIEALQQEQLELYYQPQVSTDQQTITALEALVRWNHPQRGMIHPSTFITVAEEAGLIHQLGTWVLNEACRQLSVWKETGIDSIRVAVNLSTMQLQSEKLIELIQSTMQTHNIAGNELELEITESSAMQDPELAVSQLNALRELGVSLAIDDFGTGHSSLAYIKRLPIQVLKLDRTFVKDIGIDDNDTEICAATLALAHNLNLKVVAEGVETEQQRDFLVNHECDYLQGYLFSKPLSADKAQALLTRSSL
jgi:diguanylate cyclase (GGDEF)-like protein/PAS domain S-box-containing protein